MLARCWLQNGCYSCREKLGTSKLQLGCKGGLGQLEDIYKGHRTHCMLQSPYDNPRFLADFLFILLYSQKIFVCCTSVVPGLAVIGSLTGSWHRVPQGADSCILDPQRCAHQQQHCLPGALHLAPVRGPTFFTLIFPAGTTETRTMRFHS